MTNKRPDETPKGRFDVTLDEDERAATLLALRHAREHVEDAIGRGALEGALRALQGARFYRDETLPRRLTPEEITGNFDPAISVREQSRINRQNAKLAELNRIARKIRQKAHDENAGGCQAELSEDGVTCVNWQCSWEWAGE
jgi:hypothetical protein